MLVAQKDVFYYLTLMNENYAQPDLPEGAAAGVVRGCYKFSSISGPVGAASGPKTLKNVALMGSGAILGEVLKAAQLLAAQGVASTVYSVTSWSELARDGLSVRAEPVEALPYITGLLADSQGPIVAATDYVRAVPESIRAFLPAGRSYTTLGTDGFGRSDTRAALRGFFGVDAASIAKAALAALKMGA